MIISLKRDAAAHKMTTRVPLIHPDETIGKAREAVEKRVGDFDSINYVYVVSKNNKLEGVISLRDIFKNKPQAEARKIMTTQVVMAHADTPQEKVARIAVKNNLKAIPIVDKNNTLLGVVTNDQVLAILDHETTKDLLSLSGILTKKGGFTEEDMNIKHSFRARAPWIIIGLFGGLLTAKIIGLFDHILEEDIIFASFIPLVAYIANAVGNQTQTLYIRDLAIEHSVPFLKYSGKQLITTSLIALTSWGAVLLVAAIFWESIILGVILGIAIFAAILVATLFALLIPYLLSRRGIDPAAASGPFTTVIQDFLSVLIYLSIAGIAQQYLI